MTGIKVLGSVVVALVVGSAAYGNFVPIGNINNDADSTSYGAVPYFYSIGQTEVSFADFSLFLAANPGIGSGNESGSSGDSPVVNVTWNRAAMYCNWLTSGNPNVGAYTISGGAVVGATPHQGVAMDGLVSTYGQVYLLPTENEWYKAAYFKSDGSGYTTYATGNALPSEGAPSGENYNDVVGSPWAVMSGVIENNGTYDMNGNVWEHIENSFNDGGVIDFSTNQIMVYRGGAYDYDGSVLGSDWRELAPAGRDWEAPSVGFRIVAIPEPGTISLMSLSTIGVLSARTLRRRKLLGKSLLPIQKEYLIDCLSEQEDAFCYDADGEDYFARVKDLAMACLSIAWHKTHGLYIAADKAFWSRMVVVHERKLVRRAAFRKAIREKTLECLDAFLALIMK